MSAHRRTGLMYFVALQLLIANCSSVVRAAETRQGGITSDLAAAEQAFQRVDFTASYEMACGALERGHADAQQTARLQVLCGISAAALEKVDEARVHFIVALAMHPDLRLERDLSPKIRSPYLEAQGSWAGVTDRLSLKAINRDEQARLHFKVSDPMHLGVKLKTFVRSVNDPHFRIITTDLRPSVSIAIPTELGQRGYDYYAVLVDAHDNSLIELGSESEPLEVRPVQQHARREHVKQHDTTQSTGTVANDGRSHWLPITLLAAGIASAGAGVYFNLKREDTAAKWNSSSCEQPGLTRLEQCGSVNSDRLHAERAAIGLYAAAGLLAASGITLWALDGPKHAEGTGTASQPASLVACGATIALNGVACSGRF